MNSDEKYIENHLRVRPSVASRTSPFRWLSLVPDTDLNVPSTYSELALSGRKTAV